MLYQWNSPITNDASVYKKGAKTSRSCPTYLTPTRPRKRVSLRVLDSSPQCKGRLPLLDQRSTSTDSEAQAVATDTGIVSQAGSFSRKPPAAWSTSVAV